MGDAAAASFGLQVTVLLKYGRIPEKHINMIYKKLSAFLQ
jgi:hypothetical protein